MIDEATYDAMPVAWSEKLRTADEIAVGTDRYQGIAYFWHHVYRYPLRDATFAQRRATHDLLIAAGLPLSGFGDAHDRIVEEATGTAPTVDRDERARWLHDYQDLPQYVQVDRG